ncbi:fumarate hydratase [bacterium]|nr:fumarate hydratase [bacterium]
MKQISANTIKEKVKELCLNSNIFLPQDVEDALKKAYENETSDLGRYALSILLDNKEIAKKEKMPLCQDTGMVIVFLEIGQDVHITDGNLYDAVNEGVKQAYKQGCFRKSIVNDPILRKNTDDNTPAVIYTDITPGDKFKIQIMPKGFGSENMSRIYMLKPSDGEKGIIDSIVDAVKQAGSNPCPPIILGIGIGGTMEKAGILSKKALFRNITDHNPLPHIQELEKKILHAVNQTRIGPQGFGGDITAMAVNIEIFPTHIAGLPVAVSFACNSARHTEVVI